MKKISPLLLFLFITSFSSFFYGCNDIKNGNLNNDNSYIENRDEEEEEGINDEKKNDYGIVPDRDIDYNTGYQLRGQGADGSIENDLLDDGTGRFIIKREK